MCHIIKYATVIYCVILLNVMGYAYNVGNLPKYNLNTGEYISVSVDDKRNIYVGDETNGKIDIYDSKINLINTISFKTDGGLFAFDIKNNRYLYIGVARTNELLIYNIEGKLMSSKNDENAYDDIASNRMLYSCVDNLGNKYEISNSIFKGAHIDIISNGKRTTILAVPKGESSGLLLGWIISLTALFGSNTVFFIWFIKRAKTKTN